MKIAILVSLFPPKWLAGTEIATWNIAKHLAKREHEVHVVTSWDKGLPGESIEEGFYIHRIKTKEVSILGALSFCMRSIPLIRRINPDILHSQSILRTGLACFIAGKLFRKPYISYCRGSDIYGRWRFKKMVSKLVLKSAEAVIALTEDIKREIEKICDRDVYVIPNGIDLERFENLSKEQSRGKLEIKQGEQIIIYVGRFRPEKGVQYLIQAMDIIRQKDANARLILGGEGPEEGNLKRLVEQLNLGACINFAGQIPNEKVPEYMTASNVFVLPSLSEGFGIVNLEAMASGLPIVASKVGGLPEIITDGENGFLVEPKNPEQIAERVLLLLKDDELKGKISRSNKEKAKRYSWKNVVERLEQIYKEIAKRN